jgi:hypothetical protein
MGPYREVGAELVKSNVVRRRTWRVPWILMVAGASAGALAIAGAPAMFAAIMGGGVAAYGGAVTGWFRRSRAATALDALPFPVEHNRPSAIEPLLRARRLSSVTIRLGAALAGPDLERAIARIGFSLSVKSEGPSLTLSGWPRIADHLGLLAQLLATWGRELHASHGIANVSVNWSSDGPPLDI